MRFVSTRGAVAPASLAEAISAGLAGDGGLYVPEALPRLPQADFAAARDLPAVAAALLAAFFAGDTLAAALPAICSEAYAFPAPLVALATPDDHVLELFHGPTAAFKDFGARFLAACMRRLRAHATETMTILVATSGDTGAAVAALRVAGSFDDCQRLVKQAFADGELRRRVALSSANSISLGRLLPQMAYYAQAALAHLHAHGDLLNFVIPTGNLGNAVACVMARACGLPIGRIVLATNANRTLHDFFAGEAFRPRASVATLANAMDVGDPSNFERLRWLYPDEAQLRRQFAIDAIGDDAIADTIRSRFARYGEVFCPHTATAVRTLEALRQEGAGGAWAVAATAHPAKFDTIVEPLIGRRVDVPPALAALLARASHAEPLAADYPALRGRLIAQG